MYISQVMRDIKQELGPLLKELGLRARLTEIDPVRYHRVIFETMGEVRWRSPVELKFPIADDSGRDKADWADVLLWHQERECTPLGANGWVVYQEIGTNSSGSKVGSKDEALTIVAQSLRSLDLFPNGPPFPEGPGLPNVLHNLDIEYDLTSRLSQFFEMHEIEDYQLHRNADGEESFSFERAGHVIEVRYTADGRSVVLSYDGEECAQGPISGVKRMLTALMGKHWRSFIGP